MKQKQTELGKVVGANLKRLIKESEYRTQARFAEAYCVDERTVRRWVSQGIEKVYIIDEIADFFKIDRINLLSEREEVYSFYRTKRVLTPLKKILYNENRQRFFENRIAKGGAWNRRNPSTKI